MAYGDNVDPKNRVVAIVLVGLLTAVLGYGLVNGLNISIVKKLAEKLDVVDVEEPPPPEEPSSMRMDGARNSIDSRSRCALLAPIAPSITRPRILSPC